MNVVGRDTPLMALLVTLYSGYLPVTVKKLTKALTAKNWLLAPFNAILYLNVEPLMILSPFLDHRKVVGGPPIVPAANVNVGGSALNDAV